MQKLRKPTHFENTNLTFRRTKPKPNMFVSRFETIRVPRVVSLLKCKVSLQLLCSSLKQVTEFSQFTAWENVPVWSLVSTSCNLEVNNLLKKKRTDLVLNSQ